MAEIDLSEEDGEEVDEMLKEDEDRDEEPVIMCAG